LEVFMRDKIHPPYSADYRRRIVDLYRNGRTPEQLAQEFEPSAPTIREWCQQAGRDAGGGDGGATSAEREELTRLRREDRVTVRVKVSDESPWSARNQGLFLGGFSIARGYGRDSGARLADGVVVLEGGFYSGGSAKNSTTHASSGTLFEIHDVPRGMADLMIEQASESIAPRACALGRRRGLVGLL
jgi:transposase